MKYSNRKDREIRAIVEGTPLYDSRKKIKCKYDVNRTVNAFTSGLSGFNDVELLDKYYRPVHSPSRDILTELGEQSKLAPIVSPKKKANRGFIIITGLLVIGFLMVFNTNID